MRENSVRWLEHVQVHIIRKIERAIVNGSMIFRRRSKQIWMKANE